MPINFHGSAGPTLGVEMELQLVDASGGLVTERAASKVFKELEGEEGYKHELLECTVEVITAVHPTVSSAMGDLQTKVDRLIDVSDSLGYRVVSSGTHPFSYWDDQQISPDPRYHQLIEDCQWTARRLLIFGVHTHVGLSSGEEAIAVANSLATFIPHFLSLSASSPYWEGRDTGLASVRTKIFESLPTAGLPYFMDNWSQFQRFMQTLIGAGTIRSIREVWWDVRPHPGFGTVELRICDGVSSMSELASIVALSQSLVVWLTEKYRNGEQLPQHRAWIVRENKWRAARYGIDGDIIRDEKGNTMPLRQSITELVADLRPSAERLGCLDDLDGVVKILERGTSSDRQRAVYARTTELTAVVDSLVEELKSGVPAPA
jgi:carboxylate-amine ligase